MDLLTPSEAATMAGVTRMAIHQARKSFKLRPAWTSAKGYHRYDIEDVKAWMKWRLDRDKKKKVQRLKAGPPKGGKYQDNVRGDAINTWGLYGIFKRGLIKLPEGWEINWDDQTWSLSLGPPN